MTLYFNRPYYMARRHMIDRLLENEWPFEQPDVVVALDVKAEDDSYIITADLPGVKSEDINVQVVNASVTIQGEYKNVRDEKGSYLLSETPTGRFYRMITLPEPLDSAKTEAELKDGVLTLRVPKAEEARPKQIKVSVK
jgi:HSP20 family protein